MDYSTRPTVEAEAVKFRKRHDALAWEANIDELLKLKGLQQTQLSFWGNGPFAKLAKIVSAGTKKVKAVLSLKESVVLLAPDLPAPKHPFAKGHELGHSSLEWHREILWVCDEHDLKPSTRDQLEWEANVFSAAVLLPEPLLTPVYEQYPTSMETVLLLRGWSGASIEACAMAYVSHHPRPCALLWLDEVYDEEAGTISLKLTRKAPSRSAVSTAIGGLVPGQLFKANHVLVTSSRITNQPASCKIKIGDSPKLHSVSTFNNTYRVLALVSDESL